MPAALGALPLTIADAAAGLRASTFTSAQLTASCLDRIESSQPLLGAFVTVCREGAMAAAEAADEALAAGTDLGPLMGIPLAVKDLIATRDAPTTANSRVLDAAWGKGIDSPAVARLRAAGSVMIGKATTSEFACGQPDPEKGFLIPRNPWNIEHTPGGTSSGTAIAVAAGLALGGLGTDTGGSIRAPAAANGHTGLKVTFGRVPKNDVVPLGFSLDTVGPMARSALDCALLLQAIAGYDAGDPCASRADVPDYCSALTGSVAGLRIGVPMRYFFDSDQLHAGTREAVLEAIDLLRQMGALPHETAVPYAEEANHANMLTMEAEGYAYHRVNLVERWEDYGRFTRPFLARGALRTSGDYVQAQRFRSHFCREVARLFDSVDVIVTPAALGPAQRLADRVAEKVSAAPSFTGQWNLAGLPAVVLPCGIDDANLPLALQIIGKPFAEDTLLRVADAYQQQTDWHLRRAPLPAH
jgi:aspartyl-tRNA(Asn)/glutamyl-tRNA(Gln) amidotransferase subunit A